MTNGNPRKIYLNVIITLILVSLLISCEKEVSTSPPQTPVPIGFVRISSNPEGAKIYEDGKNSGKYTPDSLWWLEEKEYTFTLKKELYRDTSFNVNVVEGDSLNIFIDYLKNPKMLGKVKFTTTPESAKAYFNGEFFGVTPFVSDSIVPGRYSVRFEKENCRTDSIYVTVQSNFTYDANLKMIDTTYWVDYRTFNSGISDDYITTIAIDRENVIWLGTSYGLDRFDGVNWTNYNANNSPLLDNFVNVIKIDAEGNLWIGTENGLQRFDGISSWKSFTADNKAELPSNSISDLAFDPATNTVYAATMRGIAKSQPGKWHTYADSLSGVPMEGLWVTGVDYDRYGNLWIVCRNNGIGLFDGEEWTGYFNEYAPPNFDVAYKCVTHTKTTQWFGHSPNLEQNAVIGLSSWRGGVFQRNSYRVFNGLTVYDIKIRGDEEKWVSTDEGLYVFTDYFSDRRVYRIFNSGLQTNKIRGVDFDSNGNAWVITYGGGLYKFKMSQK